MIIQKANRLEADQEVIPLGEKITIFPVVTKCLTQTQLDYLKDDADRQILPEILKANLEHGSTVNISSGYMHFPAFIQDIFVNSKAPVTILTAAPTANSFFEGGFIKRHIPALYRSYESNLLRQNKLFNNNITIKEYIKCTFLIT